jgi:hypothetical protein
MTPDSEDEDSDDDDDEELSHWFLPQPVQVYDYKETLFTE